MHHPLDFPQQVKERVFDKQGSCLCGMNRPNVFRDDCSRYRRIAKVYYYYIICMMRMMKDEGSGKKVTRAGRLS